MKPKTTVSYCHVWLILWWNCDLIYFYSTRNSRSQWPRGLRRRSTAARLLRSWVRILPRAWMFVCCQVEVSATDWSFVQRSPTDCGASLYVIMKPRKRGGWSPLEGCKIQPPMGVVAPGEKKSTRNRRKFIKEELGMHLSVWITLNQILTQVIFCQFCLI